MTISSFRQTHAQACATCWLNTPIAASWVLAPDKQDAFAAGHQKSTPCHTASADTVWMQYRHHNSCCTNQHAALDTCLPACTTTLAATAQQHFLLLLWLAGRTAVPCLPCSLPLSPPHTSPNPPPSTNKHSHSAVQHRHHPCILLLVRCPNHNNCNSIRCWPSQDIYAPTRETQTSMQPVSRSHDNPTGSRVATSHSRCVDYSSYAPSHLMKGPTGNIPSQLP